VGPQKIFLGKTLRKIIKIVATRWRILRLKCTKFDFGPQTPLGELTALHRPHSWIWGSLRGRGRGWAGEEEGKGEGGGSGGEGKGGPPSYCWTRDPQSLAMPLDLTKLWWSNLLASTRDSFSTVGRWCSVSLLWFSLLCDCCVVWLELVWCVCASVCAWNVFWCTYSARGSRLDVPLALVGVTVCVVGCRH